MQLLRAMHDYAAESECCKSDAFRFFSATLLDETKQMTAPERFTLKEVEALTAHTRSTLLDNLQLIRLVFTQPQTVVT